MSAPTGGDAGGVCALRQAWRTWRTLLALGAALSVAGETAPASPDAKAAYLAKFAPFVVWPPVAYAAPGAPLVLCVQGADPFGPALDRAVAGQSVDAHPMIVRRLVRINADSGCQIAYLAGAPDQSPEAALKALEGQPVLTVTDADIPGDARGIVHLVATNGRLEFAIDAARAGKAGLTISSKLLALASEVRR
jgi:hypothetical protein